MNSKPISNKCIEILIGTRYGEWTMSNIVSMYNHDLVQYSCSIWTETYIGWKMGMQNMNCWENKEMLDWILKPYTDTSCILRDVSVCRLWLYGWFWLYGNWRGFRPFGSINVRIWLEGWHGNIMYYALFLIQMALCSALKTMMQIYINLQ